MIASTPLGRVGQPDDIARVAVFLASDASGWLAGERLTARAAIDNRLLRRRTRPLEVIIAITLNHTIVPAYDKEAAARLFAQLFSLAYKGADEHFASVKVNNTLTFLFEDSTKFRESPLRVPRLRHGFDAIFRRIQEAGLVYGSAP